MNELLEKLKPYKWWTILKALPFEGGPSSTKWVYLAMNAVLAAIPIAITAVLCWVYVRTVDHHVDGGLLAALVTIVGIISSCATLALNHRRTVAAQVVLGQTPVAITPTPISEAQPPSTGSSGPVTAAIMLLAVALFAAPSMGAQITVSANSCIATADQQMVPMGTFEIQLTDGNDNPVFVSANGLQVTSEPVRRTISAGTVPSFQLPTPATAVPANFFARVTVTNKATNKITTYRRVAVNPVSGVWDWCGATLTQSFAGVPIVPVKGDKGDPGVNGANGLNGCLTTSSGCNNVFTIPPQFGLICAGDSRNHGQVNLLPGQDMCSQVALTSNFAGRTTYVHNGAVGGATCPAGSNDGNNITDAYMTNVYPYRPAAQGVSTAYLLIVVGINDLNSTETVEQIETCYSAYLDRATRDGITPIVTTVYNATNLSAAVDTKRKQLNQWLYGRQKVYNGIRVALSDLDGRVPTNNQSTWFGTPSANYSVSGYTISNTTITLSVNNSLSAGAQVYLTGFPAPSSCIDGEYMTVTTATSTALVGQLGCSDSTSSDAGYAQVIGSDPLHPSPALIKVLAQAVNTDFGVYGTGGIVGQVQEANTSNPLAPWYIFQGVGAGGPNIISYNPDSAGYSGVELRYPLSTVQAQFGYGNPGAGFMPGMAFINTLNPFHVVAGSGADAMEAAVADGTSGMLAISSKASTGTRKSGFRGDYPLGTPQFFLNYDVQTDTVILDSDNKLTIIRGGVSPTDDSSCAVPGSWALAPNGHVLYCNSGTWAQKL